MLLSNFPPYNKTYGSVAIKARKTTSRSNYIHKLLTYINIPIFDLVNPWKGASEIIKRFDYNIGNITLLTPIVKPDEVNFCPVLSWFSAPEVITRYKLWDDVGEILYLPVYNGEKITANNFCIEIWNTDTTEYIVIGMEGAEIVIGLEGLGILGAEATGNILNIVNPSIINLFTSSLITPTNKCDQSDSLLITETECVDPLFDLDGFDPSRGDYYELVSPCERILHQNI